jgi:hypothetical protein
MILQALNLELDPGRDWIARILGFVLSLRFSAARPTVLSGAVELIK